MLGLVDGANWADIVAAFATLAIAGGLVITGVQLSDARHTRNAEIARSLAEIWHSAEIVAARRRIACVVSGQDASTGGVTGAAALLQIFTRAREEGNDDFFLFARYLDFFEELGVSYRRRSSGLDTIDDLIGGTIVQEWRRWEPIIHAVWDDSPRTYENFRGLSS